MIPVEVQHIRGEAHHRDLLVITVGHDALLLQKSGSGHLHIVADGGQVHGLCLVHKVAQEPLILLRQSVLHLAGHAAVEGRNGGVKEHIGIDLHAVVAGDVRQRVVIEGVIGHAGDQPELAGLLGQRRAVCGLQGAVDGAHAGAVGAVGDVEPLGVPGAPLHLHIIAPRNAGGKREVGGDAVVHGVERPARHLALGGPVGVLAADEFPVQGLGGALHQLLHSIGAASHGASQGDLLGDPGIGDFELQSRVLHGLAGGAVAGEVGDVAVVGNVLYLGTVKAVGLGAAVDIGDLGLVRHIRIALFPQQAVEGLGDVGLIIESHTLQGLHGNILARELGGNVLQGLRLFRILGPKAQLEGLDLRGRAALERGGEGHRDLILRRRGERAGGGVHQSVIRRPYEGNGLLSTALHGNGDARGQGQEAGIGLRGLLFLLRVAAHRGKAAELIDAGGIGLQKLCILGIEPQFLIEVLLQGGQEVVVQVRDRFAGRFDAVFLAEVGLIAIVVEVIESQHILGVPVGLGFLGGVGGGHAAKFQGVGGGGSGLEVVGREDSAALPGQNGEAAVEGTIILIHAHVHGELRGAHIVRGMGGHASRHIAHSRYMSHGIQIDTIGDTRPAVNRTYHRANTAFRAGDGSNNVAVDKRSPFFIVRRTLYSARNTADRFVGGLCRVCIDLTGGIAALHLTIGITHDTADTQRRTVRARCILDTAGVHAVPYNAVLPLVLTHDASGSPPARAIGNRTAEQAVFHGTVVEIHDAAHNTIGSKHGIHTEVFHLARAVHIIKQSLGALQATDGVVMRFIAVQGAGKLITVGTDSRPGLAVEVDVGGELAADGRVALVDRIGKPCQFRGGADQVDTTLVLRGRGLGRAVPARTGIGQCYLDGVVFGSGKAAADRDIVRLGDGIGIGLAEVEFVAAVGLGLDGAAHGVGQRNRRIRRISGKLHLVRRQGSEGYVLIHVLIRDDDLAHLGLIAVLADRVGVHSGGDRILTVGAGDGCTAGILQDDLAILRAGDIERDGVDGGNGKVFQIDIAVVPISFVCQRQHITRSHCHTVCLPLIAVI